MTSTRYDGDTWDLASSVGATATMAAAARAIATRADRPLIDDRSSGRSVSTSSPGWRPAK
jgi:O-methyltransferase involved in polyketide biosynthesis